MNHTPDSIDQQEHALIAVTQSITTMCNITAGLIRMKALKIDANHRNYEDLLLQALNKVTHLQKLVDILAEKIQNTVLDYDSDSDSD